jgi:hypothetical protein
MNELKTEKKKSLRGTKMLDKRLWLRLVQIVDPNGKKSYFVEFYRQGNKKFQKLLSHQEKDAKEKWSDLTKIIVPLTDDGAKQTWLDQRVVSLPRRTTRVNRGYSLDFGRTELAVRLRQLCEKYCEKPVSKQSKSRFVKVCRELVLFSGDNSTLTVNAVESMFKSKMRPENHLSPDSLSKMKSTILKIGKRLSMRDVDSLFNGIEIPTKAQLKESKYTFKEKNRRHLERDEAQVFIESLYRCDDEEWRNERSSLFLQLTFAWRPQEACCAEIHKSSVYVDGSWKDGRKKALKTAGMGVDKISVDRSPAIDAILFLTECDPKPVVTKNGAEFFKMVAVKAIGKKAKGLDRYCLRHTALTWLARSGMSLSEIKDMAGHTKERMLEDCYNKRPVKDKRKWQDAMPLNIKNIPKTWHGFLLECIMVAKWSGLLNGQRPEHDPTFLKVLEILKPKNERKELNLFD